MADVVLVYINDTALPNPTTYNVTSSDLDSDSSRNELGVLVRNRVRQGVAKVELGWTLRSSSLATMLKLIEPASMTVKYFDPRIGNFTTATMYVGDRSCVLRKYIEDDVLWDLTFNLIEY